MRNYKAFSKTMRLTINILFLYKSDIFLMLAGLNLDII